MKTTKDAGEKNPTDFCLGGCGKLITKILETRKVSLEDQEVWDKLRSTRYSGNCDVSECHFCKVGLCWYPEPNGCFMNDLEFKEPWDKTIFKSKRRQQFEIVIKNGTSQ